MERLAALLAVLDPVPLGVEQRALDMFELHAVEATTPAPTRFPVPRSH